MHRREAALARQEDRTPRNFFVSDYLLGVYDEHRMGALRFKVNMDGPFLNDNREMAAPPWTSIRALQNASLQLEKEDAIHNDDYIKWLNLLIAPGSSIGGARPKASVLDTNGHLWIAKFPSQHDLKDVGAWEKVAHDLAALSGINVPETYAKRFSGPHSTFLTKRFDRTGGGQRIHFASAMTLLGHLDGHDAAAGASYLELAEFLIREGAEVNQDLAELWKRIVFNICISNVDDHLRNHGFILTKEGWRLSPAYDLNPTETARGLSLNISENDNQLDLDLARDVTPYFRISPSHGEAIIGKISTAVAKWRKVATQYGISNDEMAMMEGAFKL